MCFQTAASGQGRVQSRAHSCFRSHVHPTVVNRAWLADGHTASLLALTSAVLAGRIWQAAYTYAQLY